MSGPPTKMRYGFVIDHRKCIGCHACTVACKEENQVPLGAFRTWVKYVEKGTWPHTRRYFSVLRCNHCDDAPCVTICPTVALYRRADGIVDFDGARCIGCKSCMQGCPYDALYIDPDTNTAAKCHYCAHRLEVGLEPACVIVCPERAIIDGDLDDPRAEIARLVAREQVEVRKPEQGTRPKVYYVGADSSALSPTLQRAAPTYLWGQRPQAEADLVSMVAALQPSGHGEEALARPVYDAPHAPRPWGWKVSAYLWTKSIAAGAALGTTIARAGRAAGASALLSGQAEGRDFWQSPLVLPHLVVAAFVAGCAALLLASTAWPGRLPVDVFSGSVMRRPESLRLDDVLGPLLFVGLLANGALVLSEVLSRHPVRDAALAAQLLTRGAYRTRFWGGVVALGTLAPMLALVAGAAVDSLALTLLAAGLALAGLWLWEDLWVKAGQSIPLS